MLDALWPQLRFVASVAFGYPFDARSLDRLVAILRATRQEFRALEPAAAQALEGPVLDESTRRAIQLRRFRQAARAAREAAYYGVLFERLNLDPARLNWKDLRRLLPRRKVALRDDPDAFVHPRPSRPSAA